MLPAWRRTLPHSPQSVPAPTVDVDWLMKVVTSLLCLKVNRPSAMFNKYKDGYKLLYLAFFIETQKWTKCSLMRKQGLYKYFCHDHMWMTLFRGFLYVHPCHLGGCSIHFVLFIVKVSTPITVIGGNVDLHRVFRLIGSSTSWAVVAYNP